MHHLTLNLLPPEERNEYRLEIIRRTLVFSGIVLILVLCVFGILLGGIYFDMKTRIGFLKEEYEEHLGGPQGKRTAGIETMVRSANSNVKRIESISEEAYDVLPLLGLITERVNPGITLKEIAIDTTAKIVTLGGFASERSNLEQFRDTLIKTDGIHDVNLPTPNLLKRTDIDFALDFKFL